jgi:GntR family transcriptional regulator
MAPAHDLLTAERFKLTGGESPLYVRLQTLIADAIRQGQFGPGDTLPTERDIAIALGISRVTVRKAMGALVESGVLVQRRGSGTFVAQRPRRVEQPLSVLSSFSDDMRARGLRPSVRWLSRAVSLPTPEEAFALGIKGGERVTRLHRLRLADGEPMALETAVLPESALPDPDSVEQSLYAVLERSGLRPVRALQRLSATNLSARDASHMGVPVGTAALRIERVAYLADDRVIEFTRSYYRGDAYDFLATLTARTDG